MPTVTMMRLVAGLLIVSWSAMTAAAGSPAPGAPAVAVAKPVADHDRNWPAFRGPRGDGTARCGELPLTWSETSNVTWRTELPRTGWSSPVVWGGRVWMTAADKDGKRSFALEVDAATGKLLREIEVFTTESPKPLLSVFAGYASPTPVVEEGRLYVHFGTYGTAALDTATGAVIWSRRDMPCDHKEGPGSSPVLVGDKLVIEVDGQDVQYVVALDKHTGRTVWKSPRSAELGKFVEYMRKSYGTPLVVEHGGRTVLVTAGAKAAYAYDAADGKELWRARYAGWSNISRPVAGAGMVFVNTGYTKPEVWGVRLDTATGDVTDSPAIAWRQARGAPGRSSPVFADGLLFLCSDNGVVSVVDTKDGTVVKQHRLGGNVWASPVLAGGRIYLTDEAGTTSVLAADRELKVLAANKLDGGTVRASPAVVGRTIWLRTEKALYRIDAPAN